MAMAGPRTRRVVRAAPGAVEKRARSPKKGTTQRFAVSHARDARFKADGLRSYAAYRDLGFADATEGMVRAHVIRSIRPYDAGEMAQRHVHNVQFQMIYVLKGWMRGEYDGQGEHLMEAGSAWLQPPNIRHTVLGYSDDLELLEVIMPADFETTNVPAAPRRAKRRA